MDPATKERKEITQNRNTTAEHKGDIEKIKLIQNVIRGLIESREARQIPHVHIRSIRDRS